MKSLSNSCMKYLPSRPSFEECMSMCPSNYLLESCSMVHQVLMPAHNAACTATDITSQVAAKRCSPMAQQVHVGCLSSLLKVIIVLS
jgi:hypothetical protein